MAYAFDLKQVCGGYAYFSTFTQGRPSNHGIYEQRKPSQIDIAGYQTALGEIGQTAALVNSDSGLQSWLCTHGWAIVETSYARLKMQQWLKQHECVKSAFGSYTAVDITSPKALSRSLGGKAKYQIHNRDGNCCLLCRSQNDLTLQHVQPFSTGGETTSRNLVTLCHDCNQSLKSETHTGLYKLAGLHGGYEPSLLKLSNLSEKAFDRATYFSLNIMHARCELW